jgi:hypothetical protein
LELDGFPWSVNETIPGLRALPLEKKNYSKVFVRSSPHLGNEENGFYFLGALLACIFEGYVNLGQRYLFSMSEDSGITPRMEHYECMIELFSKHG